MERPADISQEDFEKVIHDEKIVIENFVKGKPYSKEVIKTLYFDSYARECLDYNEHIRLMEYYMERVENFANYIELIKSW